jgi:hypothetical protein
MQEIDIRRMYNKNIIWHNMKRVGYLVFALMTLILVGSCGNKADEAKLRAVEFLDAYFKVEYIRAAEYCTDELKSEILEAFEQIESLEPGIKESVIHNTSQTKTEIVSVDTESKKDTVVVNYRVILPSFPNGIDNRLSLIKENKIWKICDFGQ